MGVEEIQEPRRDIAFSCILPKAKPTYYLAIILNQGIQEATKLRNIQNSNKRKKKLEFRLPCCRQGLTHLPIRSHRFDPVVRKIPPAPEQLSPGPRLLSLSSRAREAPTDEPVRASTEGSSKKDAAVRSPPRTAPE